MNPKASKVSLVGDFNGWDPKKTKMTKKGKGEFIAQLSLKPGRYTYKYLTESGWYTDPNAQVISDSMGNQNSLVTVS